MLVSEGMSILVHDMSRLIDEFLPARFGGSPLDYQVVEEEDERGFSRMTLVVSPKVALPEEQAVIDAVTNRLVGSARAIWPQARTLRIRRAEPAATGRGKSIPLQLGQRGEPSRREGPG